MGVGHGARQAMAAAWGKREGGGGGGERDRGQHSDKLLGVVDGFSESMDGLVGPVVLFIYFY